MTSVEATFFADGRDNRRDGVTIWLSPNGATVSLWKRRNGQWWKSAGLSLEEVAAYINGYAGQTKPKRLRR